MATYLYETTDPKKPVRRFEFQQSMKDDAFTKHPETGEAIQRVITGGFGYALPKRAASTTMFPVIMSSKAASAIGSMLLAIAVNPTRCCSRRLRGRDVDLSTGGRFRAGQ